MKRITFGAGVLALAASVVSAQQVKVDPALPPYASESLATLGSVTDLELRSGGTGVNSCMVQAVECDGASIVTVEGLAGDKQLDPIQEAIIQAGGVQCGFCTPGILISSRALLDRNPNPRQEEIQEALVGNLCRCTGYERIIESVKAAAKVQLVQAEL